MSKKVLVSGIQASGRLHIGNYFGAMKQNVELTNSGEYESYIFIADYHSMTTLTDAHERRKNSFDLACAYLACGLDPSKVILFKQSDVPEHTELSWILSTITPMSMLELAHAYKDKNRQFHLSIDGVKTGFLDNKDIPEFKLTPAYITLKKGSHDIKILNSHDEIISEQEMSILNDVNVIQINPEKTINNAGLFTYPVLMAADILMYNANLVPVGKDQEQHIEIAREIAGKFNRAYSEFFTMPQAHILQEVAVVPGTDGNKMSKSKGNIIPLFGTDEEIKKAVMSVVTDSARPEDTKNPDENNVYNIHKLFLNEEEDNTLRARYEEGGLGYKEAKEMLLAKVIECITPHREKYEYYQTHRDEVEAILHDGGMRAHTQAKKTMEEIKKIVGLN